MWNAVYFLKYIL